MSDGNEPRRRPERWDVDPSDHPNLGANVVLNTPFVHAVGRDQAERMIGVINDVGARLGKHPRSEIVEALRRGFKDIGVSPPPVEVDRLADEIARFDGTTAQLGPEGEY